MVAMSAAYQLPLSPQAQAILERLKCGRGLSYRIGPILHHHVCVLHVGIEGPDSQDKP